MNKDQKKILDYVQSGSLLSLKTYLTKLEREKKNITKILHLKIGKQNRTPLHIACLLGDDAVVRCLIKYGASVSKCDAKGNTPVHLAAKFIEDSGNYPDYKLLLNPLVELNPETLRMKNNDGITPAEMLKKAREFHTALSSSQSEDTAEEATDEEKWNEKMQSELMQDLIDNQGRYENFESNKFEEEYSNFSQWADQIAFEYQRRKAFLNGRKRRSKQDNRKRKKVELDDLTKNLNKDYEVYLKQAKQIKKEVMGQKRERANEKMMAMKNKKMKEDITLSYNDIPWPCNGNASDMSEVILSGVDPSESVQKQKRYVLKQLVLWHPDKFEQRCGKHLQKEHKERILSTVKSISQDLNKFLDTFKC